MQSRRSITWFMTAASMATALVLATTAERDANAQAPATPNAKPAAGKGTQSFTCKPAALPNNLLKSAAALAVQENPKNQTALDAGKGSAKDSKGILSSR